MVGVGVQDLTDPAKKVHRFLCSKRFQLLNADVQVHSVTIKHKEAITLWPKLTTNWFDDAVESESEWPQFQNHIVDDTVIKCRVHVAIQEGFGGRTIVSLYPIKKMVDAELAKMGLA